MTNKINGIDVSECGFCCWKHNANELIENYCAVFNNKCICNPDCYFKELKRLKEENEELKEKIKDLDAMTGIFSVRLANKYKQALEEIREIAKHNQFYDPRYFMIRGDIGQFQNIKMTEIYERCNKELNEK
jgi:hypothetical protein